MSDVLHEEAIRRERGELVKMLSQSIEAELASVALAGIVADQDEHGLMLAQLEDRAHCIERFIASERALTARSAR